MDKHFKWRKWRIVVKVDPDKTLSETALQVIAEVPIDAIIIGGTQNITPENSYRAFYELCESNYKGVIVQEISNPDAIIFDADGYLLPVVLNSPDPLWFKDSHLEAIKKFNLYIPWERIISEGFLICNPSSAVGQKTKAVNVKEDDAIAYMRLAEQVYKFPSFYIEYSGTYGSLDLVRAISEQRRSIHLFYGGGIRSRLQAEQMLQYVDTIVIGNLIYENPAALREIACNI